MARVTHVKSARQRYAQVPVLDDNGEPKRSQLHKKDGSPKLTKSGRPIFIPVMRNDTTQPLPMPKCDSCGEVIEVGSPYKWIEPHGSRIRNRHEACPTWNVWEYSSSLSALVAQIQATEVPSFESEEDATSFLGDVASQIRELAEQKRESATNIEEGFGHETEQSQELNDIAEQLDTWADEVENLDLPEFPEAEEQECDSCGGTGTLVDEDNTDEDYEGDECPQCEGTGTVEGEEPADEQLEEWCSEVTSVVEEAIGNSPV